MTPPAAADSDDEVDQIPGRRWRRRSLLAIGVTAALGGTGLLLRQPAARPEETGALALELPDLADPKRSRTLDDFAGRPVLVNFFAAWCQPCRRELPALQAASAAHPEVAFLGVDHQDSRRAALALLAETGVTYAAVYDPEGRTAVSFKARGMPTTVLLRVDRSVAALRTGELSREDLEELLLLVAPAA